ncbi:MAG: D-3-phosphoglycerate dehydrogenase [Candidatus Tectimicrobiota bacterium]|nr:MAG: D-3-phosphoglycerate dehydrogenase [Candidatus Tectomicrobia bacterium]
MKARILVADEIAASGIALLEAHPAVEVTVKTGLSPAQLRAELPHYSGLIVRSSTRVTAELLEAAPALKVIGRAGIGVDNIDVEAATRRGIVVMNTPEGNTNTAAEHTISLLLALSRHIPQATAAVKAGRWERHRFLGVEVVNKVLGVIGLGRIGSLVARKAQGLGMVTVAYDPFISSEAANKLGVELLELPALLERADYISVHTPLTAETYHLLGRDQFKHVRPGVRIINCARGGIIDEAALYEALLNGTVAGAALDVFEQEPPPPDHPLLQLDTVICTPHLGAQTGEAQERVAIGIAEQMLDFFVRGQIRNAVNMPSIDAESYQALQPYMTLAEKLGAFRMQLLEGGLTEITVSYSGTVTAYDTKPLTIAVLRGILGHFLGPQVNYVNAPLLAKERGIRVVERQLHDSEDYASLVEVEIVTERQRGSVAGTLFGKSDPRIVRIDHFPIEAIPSGHMLVFSNRDLPGVIGRIGTILGNAQINIAGFHLGRLAPGGLAVCVVNVDSPIPAEVLAAIRALPNLVYAKTVTL